MSAYPVFFVCGICRRKVMPVDGIVRCCGVAESVEEIQASEREAASRSRICRRDISAALFPDPVIAHWNEEDEEFNDYEGIPNT